MKPLTKQQWQNGETPESVEEDRFFTFVERMMIASVPFLFVVWLFS
jgi:hypothetical protein